MARTSEHPLKEHLHVFGPALFITLLGFILAYQFVDPAPPSKIRMASGHPEGAYHLFAQRYRDYLAQEMILSGSVHTVAWVGGVGVHPREAPGRNLTGDPWWTDGGRAVLFLSEEAVPADEVRLLDWNVPPTPVSDD